MPASAWIKPWRSRGQRRRKETEDAGKSGADSGGGTTCTKARRHQRSQSSTCVRNGGTATGTRCWLESAIAIERRALPVGRAVEVALEEGSAQAEGFLASAVLEDLLRLEAWGQWGGRCGQRKARSGVACGAAEGLFLVRVGTKPKNHTRYGALQVASSKQTVQRGTMRFGKLHLHAAPCRPGRLSGCPDFRG